MKRNLLFSKYLDLYDRAYYGKDSAYAFEVEEIVPLFGAGAHNIIDIGCGTGKHAVELLKKGHRVHCIDISKHAVCKTAEHIKPYRHASVEMADIAEYHTRKKFEVALALFVVFSYLDRATMEKALRNAYELLAPGGLLLFDVVNGVQLDKRFQKKIVVNGDGVKIAWNRTKISESNIIEADAEIYCKDGTLDEHQTFRYYYPEEICAMAREAGFENVEVYSDYLKHTDYAKTKTKLCVVCKK